MSDQEETELVLNNKKEDNMNIDGIENIENNENEGNDNSNQVKEKEINQKETTETPEKGNTNDDQDAEHILSNTRENITFSQMNDTTMSRESVQTYQSLPFDEDKPDLDLPYFSPTKYETVYWKIFHSLSYFLFCSILATSTWFYFKKITNIYFISLFIANIFFVVSTIMEWVHFKRGCIGYSNLNSKLKKNIDNTFRAKILRSEYGIKYFISVMASFMFIFGNIYYFINYLLNNEKEINYIDINFINFNLFGMLTLGLSQIMKLEKMLIENKTNSIKSDFSKSLIEILLFFGSLFYGASYMIQMFYLNSDESPLEIFFIILRAIGNLNLFASSLVLQYRYYLSEYSDLNVDEEYAEF